MLKNLSVIFTLFFVLNTQAAENLKCFYETSTFDTAWTCGSVSDAKQEWQFGVQDLGNDKYLIHVSQKKANELDLPGVLVGLNEGLLEIKENVLSFQSADKKTSLKIEPSLNESPWIRGSFRMGMHEFANLGCEPKSQMTLRRKICVEMPRVTVGN